MQKSEKIKKTELGEIPEEWLIDKLGNFVDILVGYPFPSKEYAENGIRLVRGDNVTEGKLRWGDRTRYWNKISPQLKKFLLKKDDFLIGMDGSKVGKNYGRVRDNDLPCLLVQRVACLRVNDKLIQNYLDYIIGNKDFLNYVESTKTNTAIPHISSRQISDYKIIVPTVKEQQKIASILSNVDEIIQKIEQIIQQAERLKKGLMQRLLTKGIRHTKFKKIDKTFNSYQLHFIPEEWNYLKLGDSGDFINGLNKEKEDYGHGCLHVNIDNIFESFCIDLDRLGRVNANENEIKRYSLKKGDICILRSSVRIQGVGYPALFDSHTENVVFSGFIIRFRPNPTKWNSKFLTYALRSDFIRNNVIAFASVSANININQESLKKIYIPNPTLEEQDKITKILSKFDDYIQNENLRKWKFVSLKNGLMQNLLTGKIRVKV